MIKLNTLQCGSRSDGHLHRAGHVDTAAAAGTQRAERVRDRSVVEREQTADGAGRGAVRAHSRMHLICNT